MFCGKCGSTVPEGYEFCMKCGTKIQDNAIITADKKVPFFKKKRIILIIGIVLTISIIILIATGVFANKQTPSVNYGLYNKDKNVEISLGMNKYDIDQKLGAGTLNSSAKVDNSYTYNSVELIVVYDENQKSIMLLANCDGTNNSYSNWYAYKGVHSQMTRSELSEVIGNDTAISDIMDIIYFSKDDQIVKDSNEAYYELTILMSNDMSEQIMLSYNDN